MYILDPYPPSGFVPWAVIIQHPLTVFGQWTIIFVSHLPGPTNPNSAPGLTSKTYLLNIPLIESQVKPFTGALLSSHLINRKTMALWPREVMPHAGYLAEPGLEARPLGFQARAVSTTQHCCWGAAQQLDQNCDTQ